MAQKKIRRRVRSDGAMGTNRRDASPLGSHKPAAGLESRLIVDSRAQVAEVLLCLLRNLVWTGYI